jgi:succinyl-diaminopimelate desuccinylase
LAAELAHAAGLHAELQTDHFAGVDEANVIIRPEPGQPGREFMLQAPLDTGGAGAYGLWTKTGANPFHASIYTESNGEEVLYGLGAADCKLDFICKLEAVKHVTSRRGSRAWRKPFVLVGTFGKESGMRGAIKLIRSKVTRADAALVGEPTDLQMIGAVKGQARVEIDIPFTQQEFAYRAEHDASSGSTSQSRMFTTDGKTSAISKMLAYLEKLPEGIALLNIDGGSADNSIATHAALEFDMVGTLADTMNSKIAHILRAIAAVEREFTKYADTRFHEPLPSLNIGAIRTYEDSVKMTGRCQLPPTVDQAVYERWIEGLRTACVEVGAVFRVVDYKRSFRLDESTIAAAELLAGCRRQLTSMGLSDEIGTQSVLSEANVFSRFGIACVVIGPGASAGNSHAPNESVRLRDLNRAVDFYAGVIERVCL